MKPVWKPGFQIGATLAYLLNNVKNCRLCKIRNKKIFSYLPPQINRADLQANGNILADEEIQLIQKHLVENGRYRYVTVDGKKTKLSYAIIVQDGKYIAVYRGNHPIGNGRYGKVKFCWDVLTGDWHALKVQEMDDGKPIDIELHLHELKMLTKTGFVITAGESQTPISFERYSAKKHRRQQYILMKLAKGKDLVNLFTSNPYMPAVIWLTIFIKTLQAVKELHQRGVIHRDLKPDNIGFDLSSSELQLFDLGLSYDLNKHGVLYRPSSLRRVRICCPRNT